MSDNFCDIKQGNCLEVLKTLPDKSINCCVTSPPYWGLRDYCVEGQLGLEKTPEEYVTKLVEIFKEVKRVLRDDGTLWLNLGDSYNGTGDKNRDKPDSLEQKKNMSSITSFKKSLSNLKPKDLVGVPWMSSFALRSAGWYLRQDIIWSKKNCMPESVKDRCTKSHEYIFLLSKSEKYYFDNDAIKEPAVEGKDLGILRSKKQAVLNHPSILKRQSENIESKTAESGFRNKRSVWHVATGFFNGAHFATFPAELITPCILAGCPENGVVLDPFFGSGTTGVVANKLNRNCIGIELNPEYIKIAEDRLAKQDKYLF